MPTSISQNIDKVNDRLHRAARKAGRDTSEVTLLLASKFVDTKRIKEAISAGARVFGENYIQEAKLKIDSTKRKPVNWHFIGHLQKNKVKVAVELFTMIESVDTFELASEISKKAKTANKTVNILIEVNLAREKTKAGVDPKKIDKVIKKISALPNLKIKGLMAIPPSVDIPERSRPYFITLRRIAERINRERIPGVFLKELSMGMSSDFDIAIEEGATIVRVGTAIFGPRPPKPGVQKEATPKEKKPVKAETKKTTTTKAGTKKAEPKKITPKKTTKKVSTKKVVAKKTSTKKVAPKKISTKKTTKVKKK
ncbi:MAG: YggS family pyridoxal phosphate-dependent enzyme [Deltaproteobacteria bacterium]|nr:YggS family pyridoxal phosphate-dependent enzyme [Deltaproteobacteria bacterium]